MWGNDRVLAINRKVNSSKHIKIYSLTEYECKSEWKTGRELGRPKLEKEKLSSELRMYDSNKCSTKEIIEGIGISRVPLYQAINKRKFKETQKWKPIL